MNYRSARQFEVEVAEGHNIVNGRPHGINWMPAYSVTVTFDTEEESNKFYESLDKKELEKALEKFVECGGWDEVDPVERLRFFCSLAMVGQDWLDVEQFIDDIKKALERGGTDHRGYE